MEKSKVEELVTNEIARYERIYRGLKNEMIKEVYAGKIRILCTARDVALPTASDKTLKNIVGIVKQLKAEN